MLLSIYKCEWISDQELKGKQEYSTILNIKSLMRIIFFV